MSITIIFSCLVSEDNSDEFASDNLMESLKMADQYSKLQSDHTRLKNVRLIPAKQARSWSRSGTLRETTATSLI